MRMYNYVELKTMAINNIQSHAKKKLDDKRNLILLYTNKLLQFSKQFNSHIIIFFCRY